MIKEALLRTAAICSVLLFAAASAIAAGDEPPLVEGLGGEPPLPAGLAEDEPMVPEGLSGEEPPLPAGLETAEEGEPAEPESRKKNLFELLNLSGFWETRAGLRTRSDRYQREDSLGETRLQLQAEKDLGKARVKVTSDSIFDWTGNRHEIDLERGSGWRDLREANVSLRSSGFMDLKVGRQILTWGTGDLIFINDLFPKDWVAFFVGRDVAYLKAPSDAVKVGLFSETVNVDVVYTPVFDSDRYITGERISYYSASLGRTAGRDAIVSDDKPNDAFDDEEWAVRVYKNVGGTEYAVYGYSGFWKSPAGTNPLTGRATFPDLIAYGASVRGQAGGGIGNLEFGYYDSRDDRSGRDPFTNNSQLRFLVGYERDLKRIASDFTAGVQYYLEWMDDYDDYRRTLPAGAKAADEDRHVVTLRLTKMLKSQTLELSLFTFYSPSDSDAYLRPHLSYKIDDNWTADLGGNVFIGADSHTFFGQFEDNTNIYFGLRCGF